MSRKKLTKIRRADPFLERELTRYEFPLPSREYVGQILADEGRPLALTEVEVFGPEEKAEPETAPAPEEVE